MEADAVYATLVRDVLANGFTRADRTGVGTVAVFGRQLRFSLADRRLPLLTTKRLFWRGIVEELLWFLRGETDAKLLAARGVHIWDANGTRDFLDKRGLREYREGDLGPVYGFQWRHAGADYVGATANYAGQGFDQLSYAISELLRDPNSRRAVMSAWAPHQLAEMALPPCHVLVQFLAQDRRLTCIMEQRSADVGLGLPFNVASYALLTHMVAHRTGMVAHELIINTGDTHIYRTHVDALREQIERVPRAAPRLRIIAHETKPLERYTIEDLLLEDYNPHPEVRMPMAV